MRRNMNVNQSNKLILANASSLVTKVLENHIGEELEKSKTATLEEVVALELKAALEESKDAS